MSLKTTQQNGFSLVEMAIVLAIVALLLSGLLPTISSQIEQQRRNETRKYLDEIRDALLGFALANGRFPCPASSGSYGQESFCTNDLGTVACGTPIVPPAAIPAHGRCTNPYNGFLPAVTLGLSPTDAQGYAVDAWGISQNKIRYAVYEGTITGGTANTSTFTASGEIKKATMTNIAPATLLSVCASAPSSTTTCGTALTLTNQAPAVIYSVGKNGATGGTGLDETANPNPNSTNNDRVFVSHEITSASSANGEFDDIVTWLSIGVLFNRMVAAGQLP